MRDHPRDPGSDPDRTDREPPASQASAQIDEWVGECLERVQAGEDLERALERMCAEHPENAAELRERIQVLRQVGFVPRPPDPTAADGGAAQADEGRGAGGRDFPEELGDFRLIERLGGGGMGVVYLAEQRSLGRRVALKLIRPEQLYFPRARQRFRREVEAVARLSHPNIVPVFTVGEARGVPYFAMDLVEGISLAEVLAGLRGRRARPSRREWGPRDLRGEDLRALLEERLGPGEGEPSELFEGTWTEVCLQIVRDVARALEHAHQRGVLHRDIKPSNVMITGDGEVRLLDFGLASHEGSGEGTIRITRSGAQLGSQPYMSPEQIEGRVDEIGPGSDVYNLGVTLYELLTLHLPYEDESVERLARSIVAGSPAPPRRHNPSLGWDVETVCLTAMEADPLRRYASAEAFARDLSNLLELRPIEARRAGALLRSRRWSQRHPAWTAGVAIAGLALVGGSLGFALQQRTANQRLRELNVDLEQAKGELERSNLDLGVANEEIASKNLSLTEALATAERQRALAEESFARALEAVDLLTEVGDEKLVGVPMAEEARREILQGAAGFYEDFLAERGDDPALGLETARARMRVANILGQLSRYAEAGESIAAALEAFERLALERDMDELVLDWTQALLHRGQIGRLTGDKVGAEADPRRVIELLDEYLLRHPEDTRALFRMATARRRLGELLDLTERLDEAAVVLEQAAGDFGELVVLDGSERSYGMGLAKVEETLGVVYTKTRRWDEARETLERSIERYETIRASGEGDDSVVRAQLLTVVGNYGMLLRQTGRMPEAAEKFQQAVELGESLVDDYPRVTKYREDLSVACLNRGVIHALSGDDDAGRACFERSIELVDRLASEFPDVPDYAGKAGMARLNMASMLTMMGEHEQAYHMGRKAFEQIEEVVAVFPDVNYRTAFCAIHLHLAGYCLRRGEFDEALRLVRDRPCTPNAMGSIAAAAVFGGVARVLEEEGDPEGARELVEEALADLRAGGANDPAALEQSDELEPLRGRPEFQQYLADLRQGGR